MNNKFLLKHQLLNIIFLNLILLLLFVLSILNHNFQFLISVTLAIVSVTAFVSFYYLKYLLYRDCFKNIEFKKIWEDFKIYKSIENSFIETEMIDDNKIPLFFKKDDEFCIKMSANFVKRLDKFQSILDSNLPRFFIIQEFKKDVINKYYILKIVDSRTTAGKTFDNFLDFDQSIGLLRSGGYQMKLGTNYLVDMQQTPNLIISGKSGSGKTNLIYSVILQILSKTSKESLYLVDVKRELSKFSKFLNVAFEYDDVIAFIDCLLNEIKERMRIMTEKKC
ncbi:FtsK/SpoIIIE domain-containing protein [Streptococcus marmotae]|uniref:FtsK/SpoIIIE domain-containing protein n=1 Tax=Streptococcus marmotae TaxID=1825069 RepID=UPI00083689F9|nr:FtsK/SpoIIIE domain-containing protein [Streptococcus marmotae]